MFELTTHMQFFGTNLEKSCMISRFLCGINDVFALLERYTAQIGSYGRLGTPNLSHIQDGTDRLSRNIAVYAAQHRRIFNIFCIILQKFTKFEKPAISLFRLIDFACTYFRGCLQQAKRRHKPEDSNSHFILLL